MNQNNIIEILEKNPVIPVVTFENLSEVDSILEKLLAQKIKCIEVTLRTKQALSCIQYIKERYRDSVSVGVGTITKPEQVKKVEELNVDFLVSPGLSNTLAEAFLQTELPFIPGVSTPSEIIKAKEYGFTILKFFPANLFGGIKALKTYGQLFPDVRFCPTGGINENNYSDFLELPNVLSVGGSWIVK